ncbi:hypothetical protein AB0H43_02975 [Hamadaea sp. NPDC050747]|uniref:VG15 protein n=1 Tax=Hamadaea sp. NPDC050747 TaxID=3155789 RepID=UPI0033D501E3
MATPSEVAAYRQSQASVVALAHAELVDWWAALGTGVLEVIEAALKTFLPDLVATYGDIAATVAADWYADLREQADAPGLYRATLGDVIKAEQAQATAAWACSADSDAEALKRLSGSVQRFVQYGGRSTLRRNVLDDPSQPRYARVPREGGSSCAWCRVLASRGAVYLSEESAGGAGGEFHDHCGCQPTPVWPGQREPYDVGALYQQYQNAAAEAGSGDVRDITAVMREQLGIH